jgi:predicted dehydrogenase
MNLFPWRGPLLFSRMSARTCHPRRFERARVHKGKQRHKVALIGLGAMGRRHARALRALEKRYEIVGGYDPRAEVLTLEGVERLANDDEAIGRADVIVVATPIDAHAGVAARVLAAGKCVLVEKPVCATSTEANALLAFVRGPARLFVGHSERFNPVVRALTRLVGTEAILRLDLRRIGPSRPGDGGALVNLGVHDLDLAAYLGGGEITLRGAIGPPRHVEGEDFAHVLFSTGCGAAGHVYVEARALGRERTIVLTTARWVYEGDLLNHRLARSARASSERVDVPLPLEEPLVAQAAALADVLDGRGPREIATGVDGARALDLTERAAACFASGGVGTRSCHFRGAPG